MMFGVLNKLFLEFLWICVVISEPPSQTKSWILIFKPFWERGVVGLNSLVAEDFLFSHRVILEGPQSSRLI